MEAAVRSILVGMKQELSKGWVQKELETPEGVCVYGAMAKAARLQQGSCFGRGNVQGRSGGIGWGYHFHIAKPEGQAIAMVAAEVGTTFQELALWNDADGRTVDDITDAIDRLLLRDASLKKNARKRIRRTAVAV